MLNILYVAAVITMNLLTILAFTLPVSTPVRVIVIELVIGVPLVLGLGRRVMS